MNNEPSHDLEALIQCFHKLSENLLELETLFSQDVSGK